MRKNRFIQGGIIEGFQVQEGPKSFKGYGGVSSRLHCRVSMLYFACCS